MGVYTYSKGGYRYRFMYKGKLYEGYSQSREEAARAEILRKADVVAGRTTSHSISLVGGRFAVRTDKSPILFTPATQNYLASLRGSIANEANVARSLAKLAETFGTYELGQLTPAAIAEWAQKRRLDPWRGGFVKGATVNRDLSYLSAFYSWAGHQGLVEQGFNPALPKAVKRSQEPWRAYQSLSADQIQGFLREAPSPQERAKVLLLVLTGQRSGVIRGLQWQQVDTTAGLLTYRSKRKDRVIPLSPEALAVLGELGPKPEGYVFADRSHSATWWWWRRARKRLGLPGFRLHDLRVTFARTMATQGIDLITIRECLGHSSLTMTQRYIPPSLGQVRQAMGAMGAFVGPTTPNPAKDHGVLGGVLSVIQPENNREKRSSDSNLASGSSESNPYTEPS